MTVKSSICIGVDIGATFITAVIAELTPDLRIVPWYVYELPVKGVEKGKVTNEDQLFNSIKKAIKYIETVVQESSHNILVTMPSKEFEFVTNLGVYRITNENGVITKNDKLECIKRAKSFSKKQGYTSLHAISLSYKVNGELVEDPVNVSGKVIEVNTYNVLGGLENQIMVLFMTCWRLLKLV